MISVRFVDVDSKAEVSRAELSDDGTIRYAGGETAQGVVAQTARVRGITPAQAIELLAERGWSNGYLMVALTV